nr:hypothetical protein [Tanacetum cinerariifolium]
SSSDDEFIDNDEGRKCIEKEHENIKEDSEVDRLSESSYMHENIISIQREETTQSKDPFNIYDLLRKNKDNVPKTNEANATYPPGFTPEFENNDKDKREDATPKQDNDDLSNDHATKRNKDSSSQRSTNMAIVGGSILEVMDDLVNVGQTMGYKMES